MQIDIIGVPIDLGAGRRGVDMGPSAIRYAHLQHKLEELGYKIVIFPAVGFMAATMAIEKALAQLKKTGTDWHDGPVLSPLEIFQRMGIDAWLDAEHKYSKTPESSK